MVHTYMEGKEKGWIKISNSIFACCLFTLPPFPLVKYKCRKIT